MALPLFPPERDPGPDFVGLLRLTAERPTGADSLAGVVRASGGAGMAVAGVAGAGDFASHVPHGTTVVAMRTADGVIMAGDRRATAGNFIAHHAMEKVFPADRHSAVAIAGSAGMAMEMVRLFQVQLEHYEKVEGATLSLEGKANQLAQMVRSQLPMAMQGLAVVPLFAGYDTARGIGRIFNYDVTGGRYEDIDFQATGSGGRDARNTVKLGWRADLPLEEGLNLAIRALWDAADEDSATGGPDPIRGIYPIVAIVDATGYREVPEADVAGRFGALTTRLQSERAR
ncbi:MAG TPA: proteasome subunit beta [Acidimicrobiales bacterium]|nr:proteasome subunit beta [Acidimicrobiales bacterium]